MPEIAAGTPAEPQATPSPQPVVEIALEPLSASVPEPIRELESPLPEPLNQPPEESAALPTESISDTAQANEAVSAWHSKPLHLALLAAVIVMLAGGLWWFLRPAPSAQEQQAWNSAMQQDAIPAYQSYIGAWPKGFYSDQAAMHITTLKSQAEDAFAKAKAANTSAALQGFLAAYTKQGVEVAAARTAYDTISAEEAKAKAAFDTATTTHTRDAYKGFLADFGTSAYAADARQRLAACHTETRDTPTVKTVSLEESATGSGSLSEEACDAARSRATSQAENSCRESQGRMGNVRVVSKTPQNEGLQGGRILGSIFGAITGSQSTSWRCTEDVSVVCQTTTTGMHQMDICP
jgi:hypothetical protein